MRSAYIVALALATLITTSCDGRIKGPAAGSDEAGAEQTRIPRLSHAQWENTVQDLFRLTDPVGLAGSFDADPPLGRFDNNEDRLQVTSGLWRDYQRAAEQVAELVTGDPALIDQFVPGDLPSEASARKRGFIERFGQRAFRRPLTAAEIDRYAALFDEGAGHYGGADAFIDGVRLTAEAMLQSPHFVYRLEASTELDAGGVKLNRYEIANRLSYLFWNTMPDDDLFAAAASGQLDTEAGLREQATRMFDDPRTRTTFDHFHFQLFELRDYADLDKDTDLFPNWSRELGEMMQTETELFLSSVVFDRTGTIGDILTSPHTFVNDRLAPLYGLDGAFSSEFVEVDLDPTTRAGLLTQLGFLARNATLTESDPIHRGVFVNLNVICREINALPNLPDDLMPVGDTTRERINSLTGEGTCGETCHGRIINPIGFGLENYDALGQYRSEDNGFPVDAADTYVFLGGRAMPFTDGIDMSRQLADSPEVHSCYVSNLLEFAYGRGLHDGDAALVDELTQRSLTDGASIRELVLDFVASPAFRLRTPNQGGN